MAMAERLEAVQRDLERSDDPLQLFVECIAELEPVASDAEMVEVLTRCTHCFKDDQAYRDDYRYLKVWFHYIHFSDSPFEMYLYLFKKKIGSRLGAYYQRFANYLEQINDYQRCFEVYKYAMAQAPLRNRKTLEDNFAEYQRRLANYERLSAPVDRESVPFLEDITRQSVDISPGTQRKRPRLPELYPPELVAVKVEGKADEMWKLDLSVLYTGSEEFTPEEIICMRRGIYSHHAHEDSTAPTPRRKASRALSQKDDVVKIPLNDVSESKLNQATPASPTMYTKEAEDEILSLFNQPLDTMQASNPTEKPSGSPVQSPKRKFKVKPDDNEADNDYGDPEPGLPRTPDRREADLVSGDSSVKRRTNLVPAMTPIPELTESSSRDSDVMSSPFVIDPAKNASEPAEATSTLLKSIGSVINPLDDAIRSQVLRNLQKPLTEYQDYVSYNAVLNKLPVLKKYITSANAKKGAVGNKHSMLEFDNELYCVRSKLGEGGYADVFLAESSTGTLDAIKVEKPGNAWEFYILKKIEQNWSELNTVINAKGLNMYKDESFLILEYLDQGTLLDLINKFRARNESFDERLIMMFMVELIRTVLSLHRHGIIHGDLKPDNCMLDVRDEHVLKVIDFGRAIDLSQLPAGIKFRSNWDTDSQDCPEMRKNETWVYEVDFYGLANILHALLFHEQIEIVEEQGRYALKNSMKRYWDESWVAIFDLCLNSKATPDIEPRLELLIQKMERKLETTSRSSLINMII